MAALDTVILPVEQAQVHWALAVALQMMSDVALHGMTTHRTQIIAEHLRFAADCPAMAPDVSASCARLATLWQSIDLV